MVMVVMVVVVVVVVYIGLVVAAAAVVVVVITVCEQSSMKQSNLLYLHILYYIFINIFIFRIEALSFGQTFQPTVDKYERSGHKF